LSPLDLIFLLFNIIQAELRLSSALKYYSFCLFLR